MHVTAYPISAQLSKLGSRLFHLGAQFVCFLRVSCARNRVALDGEEAELFVGFVEVVLSFCSCCLRLRSFPDKFVCTGLDGRALRF